MLKDKTIRKYIFQREQGRCYYCGKYLKPSNATLDHFLPKSKGGPDEFYNMVLCCKECNLFKRDNLVGNHEKLMLSLFAQAVKDGFVIIEPGLDKAFVRSLCYSIEKIIYLTADKLVLQSGDYRIEATDNRIKRIYQTR